MTQIIMKNDKGEVKISPVDVERFEKLGYKRKQQKAAAKPKPASKASIKKEG
jgi:hypothetical protein